MKVDNGTEEISYHHITTRSGKKRRMNMNVNVMMQYVTYGLALIGVLAFLVSIIVQVIKELPGLNKIPTSIVALVTSLILCPVALAVLCTYYKTAVTWYYIFASIIAAFVVYLVATGGWEKVKGIWDRTKYKDSEGE